MFNDLSLEPLTLWHEDVLADPDPAAQQAADYLGVALDPRATIDVPEIEKQSEGDSADWLVRFKSRS
jgi:LPS sulfotransferase NodH